MTDASAGSGGADRQRKGRWRRATQVCTNCRQMKLRCDFQERFPEPCTRCASAGHARGMPCHVDPSFRRTAQRASDNIPFSVAAAKTSPSHADERKSSPNIFSQPVSQELFHENITPPASTSDPDCLPRTLGRVTLSAEEVDGLFVEFFGYYHRFLPVFVEPVDPDEAFDMSHYLFWAICSIASRRRPDHPVVRARDSEFCMSIGQEVQLLFPQMVLAPHASYHLVQALILICEFPPLTINGRNGFIWTYSGMAITMGTAVGLHRHYFHSEYLGLHDHDRDLDVDERRERILTWIQCFNVHQSCASLRGAPSLINDDYLLVKAATSPVETMTKKIINEPDVFHSLRINRLTRRLMLAVGNDASTPSGLAEPSMRKPLVAMFASDLADVESSLKPGPDSALSPISAVRLLGAKLQLHAFELHDSAENASAEDLLICYTSAIRIITTLGALYKNPESRSIFWPRSIYVTFVAASLCLLKVATLQMYSPRKINIEQAIILKELAAAYDIMKSRSIYPGDIAERRALGLRLLCSHLQNATPLTNHSTPGIGVRSRMSLGGLLYDSIVQVKNLRASKTPGVEGVFIKQEDNSRPIKSARTSKSPSGKQASANGMISQQLHAQAPPMATTHGQDTNQSFSFVNEVGSRQPVPSTLQHVPGMVQTSSSGMEDSSIHDINPISWDGTDIYNLPTTETAEWLQFFNVENCAEVMSVPGYNHDFAASWQMQDAPLTDPFNFATPPDQSSLHI